MRLERGLEIAQEADRPTEIEIGIEPRQQRLEQRGVDAPHPVEVDPRSIGGQGTAVRHMGAEPFVAIHELPHLVRERMVSPVARPVNEEHRSGLALPSERTQHRTHRRDTDTGTQQHDGTRIGKISGVFGTADLYVSDNWRPAGEKTALPGTISRLWRGRFALAHGRFAFARG